MPQARPSAPIAAQLQLPARVGPPLVNGASHALAYATGERSAARRGVVGAAQAAGGVCDFDAQAVRDAAALRVQLEH